MDNKSYYLVLMNGKEVWDDYRIANFNSAKATAKIWKEQHFSKKTLMSIIKMPENKVVYEI